MLVATAPPAHAANLLTPVAGATRGALPGISGVQRLRLDRSALAALRARDQAVVDGFPLGRSRTASLVVTRFSPFPAGARAEIVGPGGPRPLALPDAAYFAGTVAGSPASRVVLVAGPTRVHGFVAVDGEVFPFGPDGLGAHRVYALRQTDPTLYPPPRDFCANDLHPEAVDVPRAAVGQLATPPVAADVPAGLKIADVAIDTDNELRNKFASDQAALDYLAALLAASTAIYERDVGVRLQFSYIRLWDPATADPWTATDTSGALGEVRTYWNNAANGMGAIAGPRDLVHFVSGKSVQGGVAYLDVLCNASYGYGVSQVYGSFDLAHPNQIWDVLVFTHEVGHNFGSPHSHCYSPPLDECYNGETGCYSGAVVGSRGTIMSYCHLLSGGLSNIDLLFGDTVSTRIGQSVATASCLATVPSSTTTSTLPGATTTSTSLATTTSSTQPGGATTTTTLGAGGDADGDGVPDGLDACPDTPAADVVDATGCPLCPCDGPRAGGAWRSHVAYVRCVRAAIGRRADRRSTLRRARRSSCGR